MCVSYYTCLPIIQGGWSPLMLAAIMGRTEVISKLVKAGATVDMQSGVCQYCVLVYVRIMYVK